MSHSNNWLTSNISPEQGFLITLQDQLCDLQEYVYSQIFVTERVQFSKYFYIECAYKSTQSQQLNEDIHIRPVIYGFLNIIFKHRYVLQPTFAIWRWSTEEENEIKHLRLRMQIYFAKYTTVNELRKYFSHNNSQLSIGLIYPYHDSYEFIQNVLSWKPIPSVLYTTYGCEAWYRFLHPIEPTFKDRDENLFTESNNYAHTVSLQEKWKEEWDLTTLIQIMNVDVSIYDLNFHNT